MPADFNSLPHSIQKQLDGRSARIVCSWGDLLDHAETIHAIQPNVRVKLTEWPEIDLGDTRRDARRNRSPVPRNQVRAAERRGR